MQNVYLRMTLAIAAGCLGIHTLAAADVLYIKAGRLIVDATKPAIPQGAVVITDGIVTAAGANVAAPAGARQLDMSAFTVMPSLVESHCHIGIGGPQGSQAVVLMPALASLKAAPGMAYAVESGIAALRSLGGDDFIDVALRNAIEDGTIPGPHILPAAHTISVAGGHADHYTLPYTMPLTDHYQPLNGFISSPADAEKAVQLQIKYGAGVIKILASGGVSSPLDSYSDTQLTSEEMRVACEEAHMRHIKVAAHAENQQSIMMAMKAGVDSIEHGSELDQEAIDYMKAHHVTLVPTMVVLEKYPETHPRAIEYSLNKARQLKNSQIPSFQLALKSGVNFAAGSDMTYYPGSFTVFDELIVDVKYGMTPQQAIESATLHGAALLGFDKLGALSPGMEGDLIAVQGDPLTDIQAIKNIRLVVFKGKVVTDKTKGPSANN